MPKRRRDEWAKLISGQLGVSAVIVNVLIDKGVVSRDELCDRFRQAQGAAARSLGGQPAARTLAAMISYLEKVDRGPSH